MQRSWKQKALLNWLWCEWESSGVGWKWEHYFLFLLNDGDESSDVCPQLQYRKWSSQESWEKNSRPDVQISVVSLLLSTGGEVFILVPLSGKLPKAAESNKLCLPWGKQKCSLHMHTGLLDGCKTSYLPEDLITLLVPAYSWTSSYEKKTQD